MGDEKDRYQGIIIKEGQIVTTEGTKIVIKINRYHWRWDIVIIKERNRYHQPRNRYR